MSAGSAPQALRVAVVGAGSWGTAIAGMAVRHAPTLVWARNPALAATLAERHENPAYLPGIALPPELRYTASLAEVRQHLAGATRALVILGVPVAGLRQTAQDVATALADVPLSGIVWTCKGVEADTGLLPHQVMTEALAGRPPVASGVLSGPSFAREVAEGLPVALTIASADAALRECVTDTLHGENARVYGSEDVVGVEVGGALKNVMAIACGVADGLGLGTNARAALITRGLAEMTRLGLALGARADTFAGLTGLGDLVLTATGDLSRNRRVGLELGRGRPAAEIVGDTRSVAEGVRCARAALALAREHDVDMPITQAVCALLFEGMPPEEAATRLLARDPRASEGGTA